MYVPVSRTNCSVSPLFFYYILNIRFDLQLAERERKTPTRIGTSRVERINSQFPFSQRANESKQHKPQLD